MSALAVYVHIPFCRSLCTYCGCNSRITQNAGVGDPYVNAILKDSAFVAGLSRRRARLVEDRSPDRFLSGEQPFRERLVDDRHLRGAGTITAVEVTPGANGNPQCLEVARSDPVELGLWPLARSSFRPAVHEELACRPGLPSHREEGHACRRAHTGPLAPRHVHRPRRVPELTA